MYEIRNVYKVLCNDIWYTIIAKDLDECIDFLKVYWLTKDKEPSVIKLDHEMAVLVTNENKEEK